MPDQLLARSLYHRFTLLRPANVRNGSEADIQGSQPPIVRNGSRANISDGSDCPGRILDAATNPSRTALDSKWLTGQFRTRTIWD